MDWSKIPLPVLSIALLLAALLAFYQVIVRDTAVVCGENWLPKSCGETVSVGEVSIFRSQAFRLSKLETFEVAHGFTEAPDMVQVWSSPTDDGPWSLIDGIFAVYDGAGHSYGTWVYNVDSERIRISAGSYSATSTYGGVSHWGLYNEGVDEYHRNNQFFRITAIGFSKVGFE